MRTRRKPWAEAELAANKHIVSEPLALKGKWREYFGNQNPIHLEIGCGKGKFITAMAGMNPGVNFAALERDRTILAAAARNAEAGCSAGEPRPPTDADAAPQAAGSAGNLALILADAQSLPDLFGESELDKIYLQFCDPWPNRKKWAKRRLTHVRFLDIYRRILKDGGEILFKTDDRQLMEFSVTQFSAGGWLITGVSLDARRLERRGIPTEYEEKFTALDMPIYQLEAVTLERQNEKAPE